MARQNFVGLVVSQGKMAKTVKVRIQSKGYDKKVHKEVLKRKDYLVHDEGNICKEGDMVRIESIPKISARKAFAVAEIKVNKGQQFALYESLAKEKVNQEERQKINDFLTRRSEVEKTITQLEDLKQLDKITTTYSSDPTASHEHILQEINKIKEKYNIESWPSTKPILEIELNQDATNLSLEERRFKHIKDILTALMSPDYEAVSKSIIENDLGKDSENLRLNTKKNLLRKYILNVANECPVEIEGVSLN